MSAPDSARVLVTGATGLIGRALLPSLKARGYSVTRLVRGPASGDGQISWDPTQAVPPDAISGFHAVVHLAGESVVGRWTNSKKAKIRDSRVLGTRYLAESLVKAHDRPRVLMVASAVGYYGDRADEVLREQSEAG